MRRNGDRITATVSQGSDPRSPVPARLYPVERLSDELDGRLVEMGRKSPQESFELSVRFERNCGIIHGVGFVFCCLSSFHCTMGVNRTRPTPLFFRKARRRAGSRSGQLMEEWMRARNGYAHASRRNP